MKIEGNQKELDAMVEFHKGNRVEGLRLQEEFAAEFRKEYKDKDHCPCLKACRYHGNCKECVAIHRAHQEHVPNCMRPLINKKLKFSEYISAYYDEYEGADAKTKNAIMEEVFVDHVSHIIDGLIKMNHKDIDIDKVMEDSPHTREEIMKMVLEIQNKVNGKRLEEEDFKDFWDDINFE